MAILNKLIWRAVAWELLRTLASNSQVIQECNSCSYTKWGWGATQKTPT